MAGYKHATYHQAVGMKLDKWIPIIRQKAHDESFLRWVVQQAEKDNLPKYAMSVIKQECRERLQALSGGVVNSGSTDSIESAKE